MHSREGLEPRCYLGYPTVCSNSIEVVLFSEDNGSMCMCVYATTFKELVSVVCQHNLVVAEEHYVCIYIILREVLLIT